MVQNEANCQAHRPKNGSGARFVPPYPTLSVLVVIVAAGRGRDPRGAAGSPRRARSRQAAAAAPRSRRQRSQGGPLGRVRRRTPFAPRQRPPKGFRLWAASPNRAAQARRSPPSCAPSCARAAQDLSAPPASAMRASTPPLSSRCSNARGSKLEGEIALGLTLQGSYSQTKAKDPVYGGHASAMGPAPPVPAGRRRRPRRPSPVHFRGGGAACRRRPTAADRRRTTSSNRAAAASRSSTTTATAASTSTSSPPPSSRRARERIPHRNALYRNLGGWKFEDVSKQAGVDAAAWGNGVCAGDFDGDGRLDLYVTNWGAELPVPQPGDGTLRGRRGRGRRRGRRLEHGLHVLRRRRRRRPRPLRRALRRDDLGRRSSRAQRTLVWRNGPHIMVGPAGLPRRGRPVLREPRQRHASSRRPRPHGLADPARGLRLRRRRHRLRRRRLRRPVRGQRLEPELPVPQPAANGRFESVGPARRRGGERRGAGPGRHGRRRRRLRRRRADGPRAHRRSPTTATRSTATSTAASSRTRARRRASPARTFERMGWGAAFLDADLDGRLDLFFANGHIFADVDDFPQLGETYRQKNQLLLNLGGTLPRRVGRRRRGPAGRARRPRPRRRRSRRRRRPRRRRQQHGRRADAAREPPARPATTGWRSALRSPAGNRFAIGAKVTVDARRRDAVRARSARAAATCRRATCGRCSASATTPGPVDVEVRMPGGRALGVAGARRRPPARARARRTRAASRRAPPRDAAPRSVRRRRGARCWRSSPAAGRGAGARRRLSARR